RVGPAALGGGGGVGCAGVGLMVAAPGVPVPAGAPGAGAVGAPGCGCPIGIGSIGGGGGGADSRVLYSGEPLSFRAVRKRSSTAWSPARVLRVSYTHTPSRRSAAAAG